MAKILDKNKKYRFTNDAYVALVVAHIILGIFVNQIGAFSKLYFIIVTVFFVYKVSTVAKHRIKNWVLFGCAYIVAAEALFRMTDGGIFYEFSKYFVILLMLLGIAADGVSSRSYPYFLYLILLIPSIIVASQTLGANFNFRTSIAFALSGPVTLGIAALYCVDKRLTFDGLMQVVTVMIFPIVAMTTHLFLYNPSVRDVLVGTASSFATSGGFGPNQVSTILGLGMFALVVRFFMKSPTMFLKVFNLILLSAVSFRALVTLSRGGVVTAVLVILIFLMVVVMQSSYKWKARVRNSILFLSLAVATTWLVSSYETGGILEKRYKNQDALGRDKEDISTGRAELFADEFQGFKDNPALGVGASGMKQSRLEEMGRIVASHNEISRLLAEHGSLGIVILLILIFNPLIYRSSNRRNVLFYSFLAFWFATINHSAMRIAAPGFIYALALLNITYEKNPSRRKQLKREAR